MNTVVGSISCDDQSDGWHVQDGGVVRVSVPDLDHDCAGVSRPAFGREYLNVPQPANGQSQYSNGRKSDSQSGPLRIYKRRNAEPTPNSGFGAAVWGDRPPTAEIHERFLKPLVSASRP